MFCYAQLDDNGYCIVISQLSGEVSSPNLVPIPQYDTGYMGKKYDRTECKWTDEYMPIVPDDSIIREINQMQAGMAQIAMQTAKNTLLTGGN